MTTYVCPSRDVECGSNPANWCREHNCSAAPDAVRVCNGFDAEYERVKFELPALTPAQIAWHFWRAATLEAKAKR